MKRCRWLSGLCLILLVTLLLSIGPIVSHAEDLNVPEGLSYRIDGDSKTVTITGYLGGTSVLTVPSFIDGYPVTRIGEYAFSGCGGLTEVILPTSITSLEIYAFYGCVGLTDISIPNSITHIGNYAFYRCENLPRIVIPGSVTHIGDGAFEDCPDLSELRFLGSAPTEDFALLLNSTEQDYTVYYPAGDTSWDAIVTADDTANITWTPVPRQNMAHFKDRNTYTDGMFPDVVANSWYEANVARAYVLGLMMGTGEAAFSPTKTITVAEVVAVASRIHSIYQTGTDDFTQGEIWYQVYVDYAIENGIIGSNSYPDYTTPATRAMCTAILGAAIPESELQAINNITAIPDVTQDSSWGRAVYRLYNAGVLTGTDEYGTFTPANQISRAEVAAIATRIVDTSLRKTYEPKVN